MTATQADDDLRLIADSVSAYTKADADLLRMRRLRGTQPGFERSQWQQLAEMGWTGLLIPETYGGAGLGFAQMRIVAEGLARVLAPEPLVATAVLAARLVLHGTNEPLKRDLLAGIASGEKLVGAALSESAGALDGAGIATRADAAPNGFTLTGIKCFVVPGGGADGYVVSAREGGRTLLCWVSASAKGLTSETHLRADGTRCQTLKLDAVAIGTRDVIASGEAADAAIARAADETNVMLSAELLGAMDQSLQIALEYMRTRVQFGKPIGSFQGLQHRTVDLWMQKELAIGALDDAIRVLDADASAKDRALAASRAKSRCGDGALLVCREAIKLHGAMGFTDECNVGQYLQRALVLSAWLGNGASHRRRYAQLADPPPSTTRTTQGVVRESPPDTDWNAMSDEDFRHEVRSFFEANYPEHLRFLQRRAKWAEIKEWTLTMSRKGWIAPAWPREHGGMGLSPAKFIIYVEEQERWGIARAPDMGILMLGPIVMRFGTAEQKKKYLPKIISCEHVWCQGYSEPNSGSDLASLRTTAVADGDHFVINGSKIWTSGATDANHMFMLARTAQTEKRQEGISFFIVPLDTPGIRMRPIRNIAGHEEFCQEFFDDVRIPKENLVGELNKGWTVAKALLGFERLNNGSPRRAQYPMLKLGAIARAQGVWNDPEFQSKYTRLRLDVADLGACYRRFADVVRNGGTPGPEASFLKVWSGESLQRLAELSIETAGEAGALREIGEFDGEQVDILGSYYNLFGATTASGTNDIQRNIVSKRVLALPG